jgi:hypothetical protein
VGISGVTGTTGARGSTGTSGPTATPLAYRTTEKAGSTTFQALVVLEAKCVGSEKVIGGGVITVEIGRGMAIMESLPVTTSSPQLWRVELQQTNSSSSNPSVVETPATAGKFQAFAICAPSFVEVTEQ